MCRLMLSFYIFFCRFRWPARTRWPPRRSQTLSPTTRESLIRKRWDVEPLDGVRSWPRSHLFSLCHCLSHAFNIFLLSIQIFALVNLEHLPIWLALILSTSNWSYVHAHRHGTSSKKLNFSLGCTRNGCWRQQHINLSQKKRLSIDSISQVT